MNTHSPQAIVAATDLLLSQKRQVCISSVPLHIDRALELDASARWLPRLHVVAPHGWLNDPCAPGYDSVNDIYHLGFQWNPRDTTWGNISWGASFSRDLLAWKISERPSIHPSSLHDPGGVFTGCMVPTDMDGETNGTLTALYTSVTRLPIHYTQPYFRTSEAVALATSKDSGKTWTRHMKNPILTEPPPGLDITGWRDPYVAAWPVMDERASKQRRKSHLNSLYAIVSGGIRGKTPTVFLYEVNAHRLDEWHYLGPLITPGVNFCSSPRWTGDFGVNWEVSNFLSLSSEDGVLSRDFLVCGVEGRLSTAKEKKKKGDFRATNAQMWLCGSFEDGTGLEMKYRFGGKLDHGIFYAGNSFWDPKTKQQVIYGWILEDDLEPEVRRQQGWAGAISFPRVLKLHVLPSVVGALSSPLRSIGSIELLPENQEASCFTVVTLCAIPDARLLKLRGRKLSFNGELKENMTRPITFPQTWAQWEGKLVFSVDRHDAKLGFDIMHSATERTTLYFDIASENIIVTRTNSSALPGVRRCEEQAPHTLFTFKQFDENGHATGTDTLETLDFNVFYDSSLLEIFVNERTALTTRVYPTSGTSIGVVPFIVGGPDSRCDGSRMLHCDFWPLSLSSYLARGRAQ